MEIAQTNVIGYRVSSPKFQNNQSKTSLNSPRLNLDIISTYPDIRTPTKRNVKPKSKLMVQKYFTNSTVGGDSGEETPEVHHTN